ncbi:hypothetical protein MIMGU_mgv1a000539mg [Erythranthe guttata]|uniref:PWWP domain-containing protein n=1 Tax=Erythranthe guttata TaxID=4155 RepID=A0A022RII4_ERYGU|nr:hypothetical protein MIMGU_mgv1a000539mg [Erythranthe guttata]
MEEEQVDVGKDSSGGVSDSPLSGDLPLPSETAVESTDIDNPVEESFEEEDEGEIMVEIVGSDVFVDGVSGLKEGDFVVSEEVGGVCKNIEESRVTDVSEAMDVSEKEYAVTEEVDISLSESVTALSSKSVNVWNPGNEEMAVSLSVETTSVVISEERTVINEPSKDSAEALVGVLEKEDELLLPSSNSQGENEEAHGGETAPSELSANPNCDGSGNVKVDGGDSVAGGEFLSADMAKDGDCLVEDKFVDEKEVVAAESQVSVLEMSENQGCVNESREIKPDSSHGSEGVSRASTETILEESVAGAEFDDVMDSEDGTSNINPEIDEVLLETDMVDQSHFVSNEPPHLADESDTAVVNKDDGPNDEIEADKEEENQTNTTSPILPEDEEIVQADSGEVTEHQKVMEVVDVGGFSEKGGVEIPALDASSESMKLLEEGEEILREDSDMIEDQQPKEMEVVDGGENIETMDFEISEQSLVGPENAEIPADVSMTEDHVVLDNVIEERGDLPQGNEEEVPAEGVENLESIDLIQFVDADIAPISDITQVNILPESTEKPELDNFTETNGFYIADDHTSDEAELMDEELETENSKFSNEETTKSVRMNLSSYLSPPDSEGTFAISDLVWGKVRSHPWWPGQIFDPEDASENAAKYHKKDSYLVAYFGDRTFAWNDASVLRPFMSFFPQIEKRSSSETFQNAVECALEEVSRRVELGLACSCVPKDAYRRIEAQVVENTGIREESHRRYGVDHSTGAASFEPDKLLDYKELADEMEYSPEDAEDESAASRKRIATTEPLTTVPIPTSQTPKPSFKIGECIRRVASQLTAATSSVEKTTAVVSPEASSVEEMLSQLQLVARDPKKRHTFMKTIHNFFMGFRSSIALNKRGRKKKSDSAVGGSGEEFEFDDVNDSYWTDRIVHNYPEEQLITTTNNNRENGAGSNFQLVTFDAEKSGKAIRKTNSRKRYSTGIYPTEATEIDEGVKRRKQESSPAELILNFAERKCVPSEINLNKMFRRFGPLMESETEVDHETGCAKVIFKRGSDAEVARNSSEKFGIFGPVLVNYQIGYSPLISVKVLPVEIPQFEEDMELMM